MADAKKPTSSKRSTVAVIAAIVLANIGLYVYSQVYGFRDSHLHPVYGDRFPRLTMTDLDGRAVDARGHWVLALYFNHAAADSLRLAKYIEILHRRYTPSKLMTIGVTRGQITAVRTAVVDAGITYPITLDRLGGSAPDDHPTWAFLIDPSGTIRFSSDFVQPTDLRMIVERYVVGSIAYNTKPLLRPLAVGDDTPDFTSTRLRQEVDAQGPAVPLDPAHPVVIFSARCSSCSLTNALVNYVNWEKETNPAVMPTLIFSTKFTRAELEAQVAQLRPSAAAWHALEAMPGIEDPYSLDGLLPTEVVVLTNSADGRVAQLESWSEFEKRTATSGKVTVP
jgi:hypothetical protein